MLTTTTRTLVNDPITTAEENPTSVELANDLEHLEHEERVAIDRKRQEELARLRAIQDKD